MNLFKRKKTEKLDWMYSGYKKDDANDFLLGKRIEAKHIETEAETLANVSKMKLFLI